MFRAAANGIAGRPDINAAITSYRSIEAMRSVYQQLLHIIEHIAVFP